ncbi:MAG: 50S ribosomal protein L24 [Candidatus Coatesbacteria bacterium]|nr:50S ribosomal protein L24 [Candidatus Coatesbacteria bacterium]
MKIRKGDSVMVIAGKGSHTKQKGKVLKVIKDKNRVIVQGVNLRKKHTRPSTKNQQGGIIEREQPIHISNVMIVCSKCSKPTRIKMEKAEQGGNYRVCKRCGAVILDQS